MKPAPHLNVILKDDVLVGGPRFHAKFYESGLISVLVAIHARVTIRIVCRVRQLMSPPHAIHMSLMSE
jgi:hypothetical protein